jgi:nucleoside-diphosphate-sugar epimerase
MEVVLVTGSSGLIGSEVCTYFAEAGYSVHGIDNNQRASFSDRKVIRGGISTAFSETFLALSTTS